MSDESTSSGTIARTDVLGAVEMREDAPTVLGDVDGGSSEDAAVPERIGRYSVLGLLGAGGMGSVLRAWDPELDRPVAIKVIQAASSRYTASYRERLVREAQALAALSHPNVVNVFEVGEYERGVFIAMELVTGPTLLEWRAEVARSWSEILAMYIQAGRGLCAAHAKGIVHRDFKPSNVIVGEDGRARVLDFGLATVDGSASSLGDSSDGSSSVAVGSLSNPLTEAGVVMGTPAYMAPEQMRRQAVTTATDQFSFCAALWEALVGERPFPGDTFATLSKSLATGARRPTPSDTQIPRKILKLIDRGLETSPERRWTSLDDLLAALQHARGGSRVWVAAGLTGVLLAGGAAVAMGQPDEDRCDLDSRPELRPWNEAQRAQLNEAYRRAPADTVGALERGVAAALQAYSGQWSEGYRHVCDGGVAAAGDQRTFDLRIGCLRQRSAAVAAVIDVLAAGDADVLTHAPDTVAGLPPIDACLAARQGDPETALPLDAAVALRVTQLRAELQRADALVSAGRLEEAEVHARRTAEAASAIDFAPLSVEAEVQLGVIESRLSQTEEAERRLTAAYWAASELEHDHVAANAAIELAWLVGYLLGRPAEGVEWARHYESSWTRSGRDPQHNLDAVLGPIYFAWDKFELAAPHLERVLASELELGDDSHDAAIAHMNLGILYYESGDFVRAAPHMLRSEELLEGIFPDGHPDLALSYINRSSLLYESTRSLEEPSALAERGLAMSRRVNGDVHPSTALGLLRVGRYHSLAGRHDVAIEVLHAAAAAHAESSPTERFDADSELASALQRAGRLDEAERAWKRLALDAEAELGADSTAVADAKVNLGAFAEDRGETEAAERLYREALVAVQGAVPLQAGSARFALAELLAARGDVVEARQLVDAQHAWASGALGPNNPHTQQTELYVAKVMVAEGDVLGASKRLEALAQRPGIEVPLRAAATFELAKLVAADAPGRAAALADEATALFGRTPGHDEDVEQVKRWMTEHRP